MGRDDANRTGEVLLSHARLAGRFGIRVALGILRTEDRHLRHAWAQLRREAARLPRHQLRSTSG